MADQIIMKQVMPSTSSASSPPPPAKADGADANANTSTPDIVGLIKEMESIGFAKDVIFSGLQNGKTDKQQLAEWCIANITAPAPAPAHDQGYQDYCQGKKKKEKKEKNGDGRGASPSAPRWMIISNELGSMRVHVCCNEALADAAWKQTSSVYAHIMFRQGSYSTQWKEVKTYGFNPHALHQIREEACRQ
jgi:hypothetical protein